jgi:putative sterol carrier protein
VIKIKNGKVAVREGSEENFDLGVKVDSETWLRIVNRETHPLWAMLTGKLKVRGNPADLIRFQRCIEV